MYRSMNRCPSPMSHWSQTRELPLVSDEAELDSASGRAGAVDSAFSASETFFNDSGTGIIPSFTIYWRHWRMQLFSLKTSSLSS